METIFQMSNLLVIPFWVLLILAPRWQWTERIARSPWIVAGPAALYVALVAPRALQLLPALMQPELSSIAAILATPEGTTIAWMHFLAFDLFVGRWVYLDARQHKISSWVVSPILFFVFMLGPSGLLLYLLLCLALRSERSSEDDGSVKTKSSPITL